jgi:catechol 2,3-dioxygenase-like lactoylglutathione lyase family enzyme
MVVTWEYDHAGIVVEDIAKAAELYRRTGFTLVTSPVRETVYAASTKINVQSCLVQNNAARFKLIQPEPGNSVFRTSLNKNGEGVLYMSYFVQDLAVEKDRLVRDGFSVLASKRLPDGTDKEILFNTTEVGGVYTLLFSSSNDVFKPVAGRWKFLHLGFVVKDIDKLQKYYWKLGFASGNAQPIAPIPQGKLDLLRIYGKRPIASPDFKMVSAVFQNEKGTAIIQVNEAAGNIIYEEFLSKHGDGVQHLHFGVSGQLLEEKARMEAAGFPTIYTGSDTEGNLRETYYDTRASGNLVIALMLPHP